MQKLSDKGWVCKTWEGELAMQTMPGVAPEIFHFSVRDSAAAKQIQELEGQKVALITSSTRECRRRASASRSTS